MSPDQGGYNSNDDFSRISRFLGKNWGRKGVRGERKYVGWSLKESFTYRKFNFPLNSVGRSVGLLVGRSVGLS